MMVRFDAKRSLLSFGLVLLPMTAAHGHDPVFGPGPHTLFKNGMELHIEYGFNEAGSDSEQETTIAFKYGLTGDWVAGFEVPYQWLEEQDQSNNGFGDIVFSTKYRFWRLDTLGEQSAAALLFNFKPDTASDGSEPALGTGSTDFLVGITYGYESLKWYRWASLRYRYNGENDWQLQRGERLLIDLAGGIRLSPPIYRQPDTVWMLELNGEIGSHGELNGQKLDNTGGDEWFLSPGVMWTLHNFAVKAGAQIPVFHDLNGQQEETDYRAKLELEWHL